MYSIIYKTKDIFYKAKHAFQRAFRGYDDGAYWGLDYYLANIALPVLKQYKERGHTHPYDLTIEEWNDILDKIIYSMEYCTDMDYGKFDYEKVKEGHRLLGEYWNSLWD